MNFAWMQNNTYAKLRAKVDNSNSSEEFNQSFDKLLCFMLALVLAVGTCLVLLFGFFILHRTTGDILFDTASMLIFTVALVLLLVLDVNPKKRHHLLALIFSLSFLFSTIRYYYIIGPALWTFAFIILILSLAQNSKVMLYYVGASIIFAIGHTTFNQSDIVFEMNIYYSFVQMTLFAMLLFISKVIYKINRAHILKIDKRLVDLKYEMAQRKIAEERNLHLAYYDQLTGLANRALFVDLLEQLIEEAEDDEELDLYVFFIDIDLFKLVNDALGHQAGDQLLKLIGKNLTSVLREGDFACRVSGDEFMIMLRDVKNVRYVYKIANRLLQKINMPYLIENTKVSVSCSIGIVKYPDNGRDVETLIKRADIAMYKAKQEGRNRFAVYDENLEQMRLEEMELISALKDAIENQEFRLHYQPQVDGRTNEVTGFEALLRWEHPTRGLLSAGQFIPIAEKSGLIVQIGEWVLKTACSQNKRWQDSGMDPVTMAVNISTKQIIRNDLFLLVRDAIEETGLDPRYLELELTETVLVEETEAVRRNLNSIRELGVRITIDDFGTGYSAIQYLKSFPIDRIKIPMNFVHGINNDSKDESIINVILALAESMNIEVVAEGVETERQFDYLMERLCSTIQGYLFCKPMDAQSIEDYLRQSETA